MLEIVPFLWRQNLGWIENIYTGWFNCPKYKNLEESNEEFQLIDNYQYQFDMYISGNTKLIPYL